MAFLMWWKGKLITAAHIRASKEGHEWGGNVSLNGIEATMLSHIDDLMHGMGWERFFEWNRGYPGTSGMNGMTAHQ